MLQPMLGFWSDGTGPPDSAASAAARKSDPVTGSDLRAAADAALAGQPIPSDQKPSIGCNIKWKSGNEPEYYR